jgi:hypothetical protein
MARSNLDNHPCAYIAEQVEPEQSQNKLTPDVLTLISMILLAFCGDLKIKYILGGVLLYKLIGNSLPELWSCLKTCLVEDHTTYYTEFINQIMPVNSDSSQHKYNMRRVLAMNLSIRSRNKRHRCNIPRNQEARNQQNQF